MSNKASYFMTSQALQVFQRLHKQFSTNTVNESYIKKGRLGLPSTKIPELLTRTRTSLKLIPHLPIFND